MRKLMGEIFLVSESIRYVAIYRNGELYTRIKPGVVDASASESDKYEELLVNPTLLTLAERRGRIDCGGCRFLLVRYGNFYQFVAPYEDGHISVCISPEADALNLVERIFEVLKQEGLTLRL
ncbi:MAG TPA: hypothetical protein VGX92_11570 [Pyrinomonadaceae bacterium]|nr:hypothetical protein [Pyrinomonadaceae bacterium]